MNDDVLLTKHSERSKVVCTTSKVVKVINLCVCSTGKVHQEYMYSDTHVHGALVVAVDTHIY